MACTSAAGSCGVLALHGSITEDKWLDPPKACCNASQAVARQPALLQGLRQHAASGGGLGSAKTCRCKRFSDAEAAAQECDLMLVVGTSGVVYPAPAWRVWPR
jgi:NAD-dependent deacetylase